MAILSISNGQYGSESVVLLEGEVWKIDKYTTTFEDSTEIRSLNSAAYSRFCKQYPHAGRGSVRLTLPKGRNEFKDWNVFYRKHRVAFSAVLKDRDFIEYYIDNEHGYFSNYDILSIERNPIRIGEITSQFCTRLLERDAIENRCKDGGPLYFGFMRSVLYQYLMYCRINKNAKTIDQIYAEYYKESQTIPDFVREVRGENLPSTLIPSRRRDEPDLDLYDAMDREESRYNKLASFLGSPHFERCYDDVLKDGYLFLLGTSIQEYEHQEIYKKWYNYAENGFDGTIVCPMLFKNSGYFEKFNLANIVFFCVFESDAEVERLISLAIANHAEVIIHLYDSTLYPKYAKKYPQVTILLARLESEDALLDATDDFMISCYNHHKNKEKRYQE